MVLIYQLDNEPENRLEEEIELPKEEADKLLSITREEGGDGYLGLEIARREALKAIRREYRPEETVPIAGSESLMGLSIQSLKANFYSVEYPGGIEVLGII